jgi:hypothetical protein
LFAYLVVKERRQNVNHLCIKAGSEAINPMRFMSFCEGNYSNVTLSCQAVFASFFIFLQKSFESIIKSDSL